MQRSGGDTSLLHRVAAKVRNEALPSDTARLREDPGNSAKPQSVQERKIQFTQLEGVTGPVEVKDWRKLDLGKPVCPLLVSRKQQQGKRCLHRRSTVMGCY